MTLQKKAPGNWCLETIGATNHSSNLCNITGLTHKLIYRTVRRFLKEPLERGNKHLKAGWIRFALFEKDINFPLELGNVRE